MLFDPCDREIQSPVIAATTRRSFLAALVAGAAALALRPAWVRAATELAPSPEAGTRELAFVHTHTGESLSTVYWRDGRYVEEALASVNQLLRDWRTGDVAHMDPALLDLLYDLARATRAPGPYHVICGYRTTATNEMLRAHSSGVVKGSQHIQGRAIDIRLPGVPTTTLRDAAIALGRGGVGYYESTDFVHVDTARVRTW